ncbi:MAG: PAAR domain-containing protein [bacterium]|nr:PAAR domain-containing protein [bacterium]
MPGMPAAKMGDKVIGMDTHIIMIPAPPGPPVPTPLPHPFNGTLMQNLSTNVMIEKKPAATVGSIALNVPPHIPQGGPFQIPPTNQGNVIIGSATVLINGKPAARNGDTVMTCNDPAPAPTSKILVPTGTVLIG